MRELESARSSALAAFSPRECPTASWLDAVWPWDVARVRNFLIARKVAQGETPMIEYRLAQSGGEPLWVRHWLLRDDEVRRVPDELRGVLQVVAPEHQVHTVCLDLNEQDRRRIGQELHDDVCQVLAGVSYMMKALVNQAQNVAPALQRELSELNESLGSAMDRTRAMAHALFHQEEDEACLLTALREIAGRANTRFGRRIDVECSSRLPSHAPEQVAQVVRILHDALADAIRGRHATEIRVRAGAAPGGMEVRIEDNGGELYSVCVRSELRIARYRAEFLGGELMVDGSGERPALRLFYPVSRALRKNAHAA